MSDFNDFNNPQVAALPRHLKQFIVNQHYEHYTPIDHAVWRYVMRQNYSYRSESTRLNSSHDELSRMPSSA